MGHRGTILAFLAVWATVCGLSAPARSDTLSSPTPRPTPVATPSPEAEPEQAASGGWDIVATMRYPRAEFSATLLDDGRILIVGGRTGSLDYTAACEFFHPLSSTMSPAPSLSIPRRLHKAVKLADGKVLVTGGVGPGGVEPGNYLASCEIYDPTANAWSSAGSLGYATCAHRLILLDSDKVLKVGGASHSGFGATICEIYDPSTGTWTKTGETSTGHQHPACTKFCDGKVLVAGGFPFNSQVEVYDPTLGTWRDAGDLAHRAEFPVAASLNDGGALVMGGEYWNPRDGHAFHKTVNAYALVQRAASSTPDMLTARARFGAVKLAAGDLLVVGGKSDNGHSTERCEFYHALHGVWIAAPQLNHARHDHETVYTPDAAHAIGGVKHDAGGSRILNSIETLRSPTFPTPTPRPTATLTPTPVHTPEPTPTATPTYAVGARIVGQPLSLTVDTGQTWSLNVRANGSPPVWYQWKRNGSPIPGATEWAIGSDSASLSFAGAYTCIASNIFCDDASDTATLSVRATSAALHWGLYE